MGQLWYLRRHILNVAEVYNIIQVEILVFPNFTNYELYWRDYDCLLEWHLTNNSDNVNVYNNYVIINFIQYFIYFVYVQLFLKQINKFAHKHV